MASKPAPGDLEQVRRFVNTLNIEEGTDTLSSTQGLATWLQEAGLLASGSRATEGDRRLAIEVREALRTVLLANSSGRLEPEALVTLNRAAETAKFSLVFCDVCSLDYRPRATGVRGAIGSLLSIVAKSHADGTWSRLKACSSDECQWAFYDHARNRSGKWCDMAVCGNRMKSRTYRAHLSSDA